MTECTVTRLFQTLRHLRPRQIAYQLYYRFNGRMVEKGARTRVRGKVVARTFLPPLSGELRSLANTLPARLSGPATFRFLNLPVSFPAPAGIDWNYAANGKLWTYNLNYFEYLRQPNLDPLVGEELIAGWVATETTHADGWEPYPLSLRLVNWLQFYRSVDQRPTDYVKESIYRQYAALQRKREYHLGGNHLLENAIALSMAARFFSDTSGQESADALLRAEIKEQYLPDGAHFELSVMYHLILLWRQLDLLSFLQPNDPLTANLTKTLTAQLGWAAGMITPDGRYPHFNDGTDGIAPDWAALQAYATALGLRWAATPTHGNPSGYRYLKTDRFDLWTDVAAIGPDYIPGHAHADNLTFVLHVDGEPFIVDPAISTYEKNERRAWERSTRAHNTVTPVNGKNSSDVWGGFRVGARAKTILLRDEALQLSAEHDGYAGTRHRRSIALTAGALLFVDVLEGAETRGVARLHFAPGVSPVLEGTEVMAGALRISLKSAGKVQLRKYEAAVGFNSLHEAWCLEVPFTERLETVFRIS